MRQRARELAQQPVAMLTAIAGLRAGLGVMLLVAPRWCWRLLVRSRHADDDTALAVRMLAGRELALGLGGVLAARRGGAVRGWGEAGVLADAGDAVTLALSPAVTGWRRPATVSAATTAAAAGAGTSRLVSRHS